MWNKYRYFLRGVSINWIGKLGVILTTATFISFLIFESAHTVGFIHNAYFGLITYLAFPVLFVLGLILIPIGWIKYRKSTGKSTRELLSDRFNQQDLAPKPVGARLLRFVAFFTVINILILTFATIRMLHFMDQPSFCGTACHRVMNPEWVTYQRSPHARVPCVECHVGEGLDALIASKLNGIRQMYLAAFDLYNQPIPTPVHTLRPARETCEKCHWPQKFYGKHLITRAHYQKDSLSTPHYTTLSVKIDAGQPGHDPGAHWHIDDKNQVMYTSVQDERREMLTVKALQPDGEYKVYTNVRRESRDASEKEFRSMDCVDCHNRATHIYRDPDRAVDEAIRSGEINRNIPFIKRQALAAITHSYTSRPAAMQGIENELAGFYQRYYPDAARKYRKDLEQAVSVLQDIYRVNRHHHMKIKWGAYPSHAGHEQDLGCFRCHNGICARKMAKCCAMTARCAIQFWRWTAGHRLNLYSRLSTAHATRRCTGICAKSF